MKLKIGLVTSRFNEEVTSKLEAGAIEYLESYDLAEVEIWALRVPGAIEIPLAAKALMEKGCDGVVTCGAVIRGETTHYELVCNSVERGLTHLMLETGKPIGFGVITVENDEQAVDRCGGRHGNKGTEAAQVCMEMLGLLASIKKAPQSLIPADLFEKSPAKPNSKNAGKQNQTKKKSR